MMLGLHLIYILSFMFGTSGYENLAYLKPADMSGTFDSYRADLSNDGDKKKLRNMNDNSCSHTSQTDAEQVWWQVDLENIYLIKMVEIIYRRTFGSRLAGFSIYLSNSSDFKTGKQCFHYTSHSIPPVHKMWPCTGYGQFVTIYNERNSPIPYPKSYSKRAYLELCEVQIFGCPYYKYGKNCLLDCFCENITCDYETGVCPEGCKSGHIGSKCNRCMLGKFGKKCEQCGNCILDTLCDPITGECTAGCKIGWQPPTCLQECRNGTFGPFCSKQCGHCFGGEPCHPVTGVCSNGCEIGYIAPNCQTECEPGKFGEGCSRQCGFCKEYSSCDKVTGICSHGCRSGWQRPDCTKACSNQTYGENCQYACGHCKKNIETCDIFSGVCADGCDLGFIGDRCDKVCEIGLHGLGCKHNCGNCHRNESCNHQNGTCPNGCIPGWDPPLCVACIPGHYGPECKQKCGNCLAQEPCDQRSGECPNGCEKNWNGSKCEFKIIYKDTRFIYIKVLNYPILIVCAVITVCSLFGVVWCLYSVLERKRFQINSCIAVAYKDINSSSTSETSKETHDSVQLVREESVYNNEDEI